MDVGNDLVCRLCLKMPLYKSASIDETVRQMLDVLLVKMNLDLSDKPLMCEDCTEIVKRSLSFKSVCMDSEEMLLSFDTDVAKANIDLRDVYAYNFMATVEGNSNVCRFCIKKVEERTFTTLNVLMKENTFSEMLKQYMFQMDLNVTKNPLICLHCRENMEKYFKFLINCHDTEEKINTYRRNYGIGNGEKILLINVFETYFKNSKEGEICNSIMEVKQEFDREDDVMDSSPRQKGETNGHLPCTYDTKDSINFRCRTKEDVKVETIPSEMSSQVLKIDNEELIIKDEVTLNDSTNQQKELEISKVRIYRCDSCEFQTKYKYHFKRHLLTHKDLSDVPMYQCDNCEYQTKRKAYLKKHMITHKVSSDVQLYQCDSCEFQTKYKWYLKNHLLIHKDASDVQTYQCDNCEFQTKFKGYLRRHLLAHKNSSDVYLCDICEFQTKNKYHLKSHLLDHKDSSDVQIYKCGNCEYQTKRKDFLKRHLLIHKGSSDVQIYQCDNCEFRTKNKYHLKRHLLTHKDLSDVQIYQCDNCEYQTKRKDHLGGHLLTHKDSSDVQMYQCDNCDYQAKRKDHLRRHLLTHKDSSDVQMYQCDKCEYQTKRKDTLGVHLLVHKHLSDVPMYQCYNCQYKTISKADLRKHMITHKDSSDVQM